MSQTTHQFFATSPRGLEDVLRQELTGLGASAVIPTQGGVSFKGEFQLCYRANLHSRIASRILWQVATHPYQTEEDIYKTVYALPWPEWFDVNRTIMVKVSAQHCPLNSLDFATLRIKDAVCDKFRELKGERPSVNTDDPDIRIHAFLNDRQFTLYLDTSGIALFQRKLRKHSVEAPLRENLTAGILKLAGWQPGIPLLDPMCGSGTFLMEAAQMALNIAPGISRHFAFERLHNFDAAAWEKMRAEAQAKQLVPSPQPIYGSDLYGDALKAAQENLMAAGLQEVVQIKQVNVLEVSAPTPEGILVTNPPYGVRIGDLQELAELYPKLGDVLKQKFAGWRAYIFTGDLRLPKFIRLTPSRKTPLFNGALECRLYEFKVVAGSMRKVKSPEKP
jgi:putative N6-adenine-specific DNA methylase